MWDIGGMILRGETKVPALPPQMSQGLAWDQNRTWEVKGQEMTSLAMARPLTYDADQNNT
jgi:hypothetical protein